MAPKISKLGESSDKKETPTGESLLIRQRLRNLIELAVAIGQKEGLLGNHKEIETNNLEGGQDVTNKGNIGNCEVAQVGQDKAGNQEGK
ncbi:hypothetical protein [Dehalococcoides mccartyi]|uniref:hypothetical protein n=1 Tax=Dehalococcoides mccartyi TaxID=61435 RepID=UPI0018C39037|nr:hypothetical protein [Dehalococcoides mccartyi]